MQTYHIRIDQTGREIAPHGTEEFPVAVYTTQIRKNLLGFIDWHWHQELQFCCVTHGEVIFQIEDRTIHRKEGEGLFIAPGLLHRAQNYPGTDSSYVCLCYHPRLLQHAADNILDRVYVTPYLDRTAGYCLLSPDVPWQQTILETIIALRDRSEVSAPDYFAMYLQILQIWHLLYQGYLSARTTELTMPQSDVVHRMVAYVNLHYRMPIRLEELASSVNLAESTCCRMFKKSMGCTIFEYLNNVRLLESERLLLETTLPITDIAMQCGYGTASYYNRNFKAMTGMSPRAYRRLHAEPANEPAQH